MSNVDLYEFFMTLFMILIGFSIGYMTGPETEVDEIAKQRRWMIDALINGGAFLGVGRNKSTDQMWLVVDADWCDGGKETYKAASLEICLNHAIADMWSAENDPAK